MRIVLFDEINESAVPAALGKALARAGCEVHATGRVFAGHEFPRGGDEARIAAELDRIIDLRPDAMFNFRASTLRPNEVQRLRQAGIRTIVWFPDDPVLYRRIYSQLVDVYDHALHCGDGKVLAFYERRGHRPSLNFPFWYDQETFRYNYDPERASKDACPGSAPMAQN